MITMKVVAKTKSARGRSLEVLLDELELEVQGDGLVLRRGGEQWPVGDGYEVSITVDWEEVEVSVRGRTTRPL